MHYYTHSSASDIFTFFSSLVSRSVLRNVRKKGSAGHPQLIILAVCVVRYRCMLDFVSA